MVERILYDCGCYASGDNVANKCAIHGCGGKEVSFEASNNISILQNVCTNCNQLRARVAELEAENERLLRCLADYPAGNQTEPDVKAALREVE